MSQYNRVQFLRLPCDATQCWLLVPVHYSSPEEGVVSPLTGPRDITLLMRFGYQVIHLARF